MSNTQDDNKIIIQFEDEPLLAELELPELIKEYKRSFTKEVEYAYKTLSIRDSLKTVVETVKADTVVYRDWKSTIVRPTQGKHLDMDDLRTNMMKMGKLDAVQVAKILAASLKDNKPPVPYVRISAPKGELPKRPKAREDADE